MVYVLIKETHKHVNNSLDLSIYILIISYHLQNDIRI